jgi:uncharacterized protein
MVNSRRPKCNNLCAGTSFDSALGREHARAVMSFSAPPPVAAWRHLDAREGFEVVYLRGSTEGYRIEGHTVAVEAGAAWAISYTIALDAGWATRRARVSARWAEQQREITLEGDGRGHWTLDSAPVPELDGCLDVDLEASAFTNAFPIRRLDLDVGRHAAAPAVYVRALDLAVERLEQDYTRRRSGEGERVYDYRAPVFEYAGRLIYDSAGLVLDYPGIAVRIAARP